jgi:hypothetical protein
MLQYNISHFHSAWIVKYSSIWNASGNRCCTSENMWHSSTARLLRAVSTFCIQCRYTLARSTHVPERGMWPRREISEQVADCTRADWQRPHVQLALSSFPVRIPCKGAIGTYKTGCWANRTTNVDMTTRRSNSRLVNQLKSSRFIKRVLPS